MQMKRVLVAAVLLPPFYLYIMKLPEVFFFALLLVVSVLAQWEFYTMYRIEGLMKTSGMVFGICTLFAAYLTGNPYSSVPVFAFMAIIAARLFGRKDPSSSLRDISCAVLALFYVPGLLSFLISVRHAGPQWIIFLFACVWLADSFALYVGKSIGKRKLYAEVSPNKTVAGAVGSLAGGALSGIVLNRLLLHEMDAWGAALLGMIIGATTIVGDLVESMFKRDAGVKDSSDLIPGHGGVLDKVDGALFAGPVLYWVSQAAGWMR